MNNFRINNLSEPLETNKFIPLENNHSMEENVSNGGNFPLDALPRESGEMAKAVCDVLQVPDSLPGVCILGVLSASLGKGIQVESAPNRFTRTNIYLLASAESGTGKSEVFRLLANPFFIYEESLIDDWLEKDYPGLKAKKGILAKEVTSLEGQVNGDNSKKMSREERENELTTKHQQLMEIESKLHGPRLHVEDVTEQKLEILMQRHNETLSCLSDDARQVVDNFVGRNRNKAETEDGFWIKAWTGSRHTVDRISNGRDIYLKKPWLSSLLLVQPDKLDRLLKMSCLTDGGFLPRFLICHTNAQPQLIDRSRGTISQEVSDRYDRLLTELIETYRLHKEEPYIVQASPEAIELLDNHFNELVKKGRVGGELKDIRVFVARWNEQAWRIALILHTVEWRRYAPSNVISKETAQNAIRIMDYFAAQQLELLYAARKQKKQDQMDEVLNLLETTPTGISARDVQRSRITGSAPEAHQLLEDMVKSQKLVSFESHPPNGGKIVTLYKSFFSNAHV